MRTKNWSREKWEAIFSHVYGKPPTVRELEFFKSNYSDDHFSFKNVQQVRKIKTNYAEQFNHPASTKPTGYVQRGHKEYSDAPEGDAENDT